MLPILKFLESKSLRFEKKVINATANIVAPGIAYPEIEKLVKEFGFYFSIFCFQNLSIKILLQGISWQVPLGIMYLNLF